MKRIVLLFAVFCALGLGNAGWSQEPTDKSAEPAPAAAAPATSPAPALDMNCLQDQINQLKAQLEQLQAQLAAAEAAQENTNRDVYAINDAVSQKAQGDHVKVGGYIQTQVTDDRAVNPHTDFQVRRARIKVEAPVTPIADAVVEVDASRSVSLKDGYIDLWYQPTDPMRLRMGQAKVPDMYDIIESASTRLCPEQTALALYLFPSEYEQGAWFKFNNILSERVPGTTLELGVEDGQGPATADLNNNKDVMARLRFNLGNCPPDKVRETNTAYIGFVNGEFGVTNANKSITNTVKQYLGGGVSYQLGPFWLRGEYQTGNKLDTHFSGYYGQVAYGFPNLRDTLFARYDTLDQNTNLPNHAFSNLTLGLEHFLDPHTRVILAWEDRSPEDKYGNFTTTNGSLTTLRLQVKF